VAADRGIQIAEQTGDLTLIGSAARRVAHALSATHQSTDAVHLVKSAANRLEPHLANADPAFTSAYGILLLKAVLRQPAYIKRPMCVIYRPKRCPSPAASQRNVMSIGRPSAPPMS
jgi:hypothetical protein